jgi:hypothetical protein
MDDVADAAAVANVKSRIAAAVLFFMAGSPLSKVTLS